MSTSVTRNYTALLTTTFENVSKKAADIISKDIPLYWKLLKAGRRIIQGGSEIRRNVMVRFNTDGGSFSKGDVVSATDQNPLEPAFWQMAHLDKPTILFDQDMAQNKGPEAIMDLGKKKMEQTLLSFKKDISVQLYGAGGADMFEGMKKVMNKDTLTTDSYGGLSRATYSTWRPYDKGSAVGACYTSTVPTEQLTNALRVAYVNLSVLGQGNPDLIITSVQGIDYYESRVFEKFRTRDQATADAGFENYAFKGAVMIADPYLNTTDGTCQGSGETFYIYNTKTWEWVVLEGSEYRTIHKVLEEQIGERWDTLYYGQLICDNPRCNGLLYGVTATAAS